MKPFNLEKALAGDPVVTRNGRPVTNIHRFNDLNHNRRLYGVIDGKLCSFLENGRFSSYELSETDHDLFMAPKIVKKSGWVNIYPNNRTGIDVFLTKISADRFAEDTRVACVCIGWEEEE